MNLFHIRYFVKLAEVGHYTKAAQELHITQPSLSHAISQLENELGVPLLKKMEEIQHLQDLGMNFWHVQNRLFQHLTEVWIPYREKPEVMVL